MASNRWHFCDGIVQPRNVRCDARTKLPLCLRCTSVANRPPKDRNTLPRGLIFSERVKASRCIGDTVLAFGEEKIGFFGGEGGRGWSIPATLEG